MDPYLEHPARWPGLHQSFMTYMREALNAQLPPGYVADLGERLYVTQPARSIYPDVAVWRTHRVVGARPRGSTAAALADPPWILSLDPIQVREVFIEITRIASPRRLVTVIELLSHTNKQSGDGRELYLKKQDELLCSDRNLIEIDLLRSGEHTVAAPKEALLARGTWDYLVCLHRGGAGADYEVWPLSVQQRLPRILIPLLHTDDDLMFELQPVFDRAYDTGPYAVDVDYELEPEPSLGPEQAAWADALLRERCLRPRPSPGANGA
jgi:hypothetical protein